MHEMAIAASLVDSVLAVARKHDALKIEAVELEIGVLQLVVPEALELAFTVAAAGTLADGATLKMVEVPAAARCRACDCGYEPAINDYVCPQCGQADAELVAGNEIVLKNVVCQVNDAAAR